MSFYKPGVTAREGKEAWAVRGKGKEEGWAGRAGALGQGGKRAGGRGERARPGC